MSVEVLPLLSVEERKALVAQANQPARSKYGAKRCDGLCGRRGRWAGKSHDSLAECRRWGDLLKLERAGIAWHLTEQVTVRICPDDCYVVGHRHIFWRIDFYYVDESGEVYEDVTGVLTEVKNVKRHLLEAYHHIRVRLT